MHGRQIGGHREARFPERREGQCLRAGDGEGLAAYAEERKGILTLRALVASADGKRVLRAQAEGGDPVALGEKVVRELRQRGAAEILGL